MHFLLAAMLSPHPAAPHWASAEPYALQKGAVAAPATTAHCPSPHHPLLSRTWHRVLQRKGSASQPTPVLHAAGHPSDNPLGPSSNGGCRRRAAGAVARRQSRSCGPHVATV